MPQLYMVCWRATVLLFREEYCTTMIRGYVAVVAGDSASADILPDSDSCKKTAVKLTTADEDRFEFYISIKGTDYSFKVIGNVRTVDIHNIASGLLRIGFIVPNLDIVVSGNRQELEDFVYTLVAVKDPRELPPMCSYSTHKRKFKCKKQICSTPKPFYWGGSKCPVASCLEGLCSFCCYHILKCHSCDDAHKILNTWKSRIEVTDDALREYVELRDEMKGKWPRGCLCDFELDTVITDPMMRLNSITVNSYPYLKKIDASRSSLAEIPQELGSLPCLTTLKLQLNLLREATNWNWLISPFLRENLCELDLSFNGLFSIPESILCLRNLKILDLTSNCLTELPTALGSLKFLRELRMSGNNLLILPGWMYRKERFYMLYATINDFYRARDIFDIDAKPQLQRNDFETVTVPSLFKIVATYIIANSLSFWEYNIPTTIAEYLEAAYICRCDSVVFPDTTGPVVQCWIDSKALAKFYDGKQRLQRIGHIHLPIVTRQIHLPIAIRCCSYECYKLIEPFFYAGNPLLR